MDWKIFAIVIGVIVIAAVIPIIVLSVKLRSARRDSDKQWNRAERAVRDHERTLDELARIHEQIEIEGMTDEEILSGLRDDIANWSASDSPKSADDSDPGSGT